MGAGRQLPVSSTLSPASLGYVTRKHSPDPDGSQILLVLSVAMSQLCPLLPAGPRTSVTQQPPCVEDRGGGATFLIGD